MKSTRSVGLILCVAACLAAALLAGCGDRSESVKDQTITLYFNNYNAGQDECTGIFSGTLVDGLPEGQGVFEASTENGMNWVYEGAWVAGHMTGEGTTFYNTTDGYTEMGTYKDDLFVSGTIVFGDCCYEGALDENGYYTGTAKLSFRTGKHAGDYYEGDFADGCYNGQGVYHYADGRYYEGAFVDDAFCGEGTFYNADGSYFKGVWADDMLNGQGAYYDKDGNELASGIYKNNVLEGSDNDGASPKDKGSKGTTTVTGTTTN